MLRAVSAAALNRNRYSKESLKRELSPTSCCMSDGHTPLVSSDGLTIFSFPVTMLLYFSCRAVCALSRFLISWLSCVFFSCKSEACQKHRKSSNKSAVHEY